MHKTLRITLDAQHVHVDLDQTSFSFYIYLLCSASEAGLLPFVAGLQTALPRVTERDV